jgi:hypothetical protein
MTTKQARRYRARLFVVHMLTLNILILKGVKLHRARYRPSLWFLPSGQNLRASLRRGGSHAALF